MGTFLCENSTCSPFSAELSHFSSPQSSDGAETRMGGATDSPLSSYRRRTVSTYLFKISPMSYSQICQRNIDYEQLTNQLPTPLFLTPSLMVIYEEALQQGLSRQMHFLLRY